jgi:hypothetical protein
VTSATRAEYAEEEGQGSGGFSGRSNTEYEIQDFFQKRIIKVYVHEAMATDQLDKTSTVRTSTSYRSTAL